MADVRLVTLSLFVARGLLNFKLERSSAER